MIILSHEKIQRLRFLYDLNLKMSQEQYDIQDEMAKLCGLKHSGPTESHRYAQSLTFEEFLDMVDVKEAE